MTLAEQIKYIFKDEVFSLKDVYEAIPSKPKTTIRGRIYDNINKHFKKLGKNLYTTIVNDEECIVIEGDGRDLSFLENNSIHCIITDHPWEDKKSNIGGDRKFTDKYDCFKYIKNDFKEKFRVLKEGHFLVEILPAENENNFDYLYKIKQMALECGFKYYSKVSWIKGTFVSNTGRKSKNSEDVMIFSKGKARPMRIDVKKSKKSEHTIYMSGTNGMLPTAFNVQSVSVKQKVHQSEKPVQLLEQILEYVTFPGELILDQFAGSGSLGLAALNRNRSAILIELLKDNVDKILYRLKNNFNAQCYSL